jgi:vacuolar-type H+-ATPase subunit I/STV1
MKIFNKGARAFKFHGKDIVPDQFTDLTETIGNDPKRAAQAAALIKDYPHELLAGENASADAKAAIGRATTLEKENATLKAQVEKLQKLLVSTDATATETALVERAEKAEARVAELESQVEALTAPTAPEPPVSSPATAGETGVPETAPAPAKSTGGKKNRTI